MCPEYPNDFHIIGGFMGIQALARAMDIFALVEALFECVQHFWMNIIHPEDFTVFGQNIRTNNYVESLHSMLKTTIGLHPPIWTFWGELLFYLMHKYKINLNCIFFYYRSITLG